MGISWASDSEIMWFKSPKSSTSMTTTFMKDSKSDKIVLKAKIQTQSKGKDWSNEKTNGDEHLTTVKSLT
jgi:hypothetical protein